MKIGKIATISGLAFGLSACSGYHGQIIQTTGDVPNNDTENIEQTDTLPLPPPQDSEFFIAAGEMEEMPEYSGGDNALHEFLENNLKYPQAAKDSNIQGQVLVLFDVEKDGSLTNPTVIRDIGGGFGEEALRVVKITLNGSRERCMENESGCASICPLCFSWMNERLQFAYCTRLTQRAR